MKNRLQTLWDEVTPEGGPCPQPAGRDVRRRVDAALRERGQTRRTVRPVRLAGAAAVLAAVLLTGSALASGELIPHPFNVLNQFFYRGENAASAIALMTIDPVSVHDDNYTVTVTSSLADGNKLYFTLLIEAHSDEAWDSLKGQHASDLLSVRVPGFNGLSGCSTSVDPDNHHTLRCSFSAGWGRSSHAAVKLNLMEDGQWLKFPVKPVRSVTVEINAGGQGFGTGEHAAGGPVTLKTVEISPLSFQVDYTTPLGDQGQPLVYFLYTDGTVKSRGQLDAIYPSGHSGQERQLFGGDEIPPMHSQYSFKFSAVQDLSGMEAVIFESMAYPLDGGDPYPVDMSGYLRPFTIPRGEELGGDFGSSSVPFFALCDGLGIPYTWDEETGTASAARSGVTLTFTRGSTDLEVTGPDLETSRQQLGAASAYRDGEFWVDSYGCFWDYWELGMFLACENSFADDGAANDDPWTDWVVVP